MYEANGTPVIGRESLTRKDYCLLVRRCTSRAPFARSLFGYGVLVTALIRGSGSKRGASQDRDLESVGKIFRSIRVNGLSSPPSFRRR